MKNLSIFLLLLFFLTYSCKNEKVRKKNIDTEKKISTVYIYQKNKINDNVSNEILKVKNFNNLIKNFNKDKYSWEELIDKTKQNLSYIHPLTFQTKNTILDTTAIKSRIILTEVHLKKLNYLLQKKIKLKDTVEKLENQIVTDINRIVNLIDFYKNNTDEFKQILEYDSLHLNVKKGENNNPKSIKIKTKNLKKLF